MELESDLIIGQRDNTTSGALVCLLLNLFSLVINSWSNTIAIHVRYKEPNQPVMTGVNGLSRPTALALFTSHAPSPVVHLNLYEHEPMCPTDRRVLTTTFESRPTCRETRSRWRNKDHASC